MQIPVRPARGGFLRPFGCGWYVREFLLGHGPYGAPPIDPEVGAPQADIFRHYKEALMRHHAEDAVAREMERRARQGLSPYTVEEMEVRMQHHLSRIPYKGTACRYDSFIVYFSNLKRLGWVEATGREEPSAFQAHYPEGPPRRFYRLTKRGTTASDEAWSDPLATLYSRQRR